MGKKGNWSWTSALVGAATATAAATLLSSRPRDPSFNLISIKFNSFDLNFPALDTIVGLTVHVSNPNTAAIQYSSTKMSIYYAGSLLGSAPVESGSQKAQSCKVLQLPARLSGKLLAQHAKQFLADVSKREMVLEARVDIQGAAKVLWWNQKFRVHVDSHVTVDPVLLEVINQQNESKMVVFGA